MRGFSAKVSGAAAISVAFAFAACADLFHDTDWPSKCDITPDAEGCHATSNAGGARGSTGNTGPGSGGAGTTSSGATGAGGAAGGGGGASCAAGKTRCGSACVDTRTDPKHCGSCDVSCKLPTGCVAKACTPYPSCKALHTAYPNAASGVYSIDPDGAGPMSPFDVYCDMTTQGGGFTLVLKLSAGDFCFASTHWTDGNPFNPMATLDPTLPATLDPDAKSAAFDQLADVTSLLFVTALGDVTTTFASAASPRDLMTAPTIPFATYPDRAAWVVAFGHDRNEAPIFMRGGVTETTGNTCRTNPAATPSGCGQPCMFCYQAADGDCCGCDATANDTNSGVGTNVTYCGGGIANCSAAGDFSNPTGVALVWAR